WRSDVFKDTINPFRTSAGSFFSNVGQDGPAPQETKQTKDVVLFADTFNRYFERENLDAAVAVLTAGGYRVYFAQPTHGGRALCCGRTFLSVGKVSEARHEAVRTLAALK